MRERITKILEIWYLDEPALFQVLCSHELVEKTNIECPLRCGRRRIEFNPVLVREMSRQELMEALKTEAIRILLKHPYERRPDMCCSEAIALGSNVCIGDQYNYRDFKIEKPADFKLEKGQPFEWYARKIQELLPPGDEDGDGDNSHKRNRDLSELWEEDEMTVQLINGIIESTTKWGSLSGNFAEILKASTKAKINWRNVFAGFRASVLSSRRKLTRMRPNRRSGFEQMGSAREFDTKLLIAVDVSGSISSSALSYFYGVINSAFKYGFEEIDVIQFDCGITQIQSLKKVMKEVTAIGRGGTSFQEPIDYAHQHGYDGLMILTDGYAPEPELPTGMRCKLIWVCQDKASYDCNHDWMQRLGRVCIMEV